MKRKKKVKKIIGGHLRSTKVDGTKRYNEEERETFLKNLKEKEISRQELLDILRDPDVDGFSYKRDKFIFDARENKATFGKDMGDNERLIMKKIELDSYLMTSGIYTPVEEVPNFLTTNNLATWFGLEVEGAPLEIREFINNPQFLGFNGNSAVFNNTTYKGVIGKMWTETYAAWLILKEIDSKPTIQEKWESLSLARTLDENGRVQYDIPNPTDIDPNANINTSVEGHDPALPFMQMSSLFHFYKDGICFLRSDKEVINKSPLDINKPIFSSSEFFNQKSLNKALKLKEEVLALAADQDNLVIDEIEFPELDMVEIHAEMSDRFVLDTDEILKYSPFYELIPEEEWDFSNRKTKDLLIYKHLVDGYLRHLNTNAKDLGYQFIRRYIASYTKKGVYGTIIEQARNLNIEGLYNETQERLQDCYDIIDSIEKGANEAGLSGAEILPIKYRNPISIAYPLLEDGTYDWDTIAALVDEQTNPTGALQDENGDFIRPDIKYLYGFDPYEDDC